MIRFLADENFNGRILRGLLRRLPSLDIVRVQDLDAISGAEDPEVLAWAAEEGRILLTHDVSTMGHFASLRLLEGESMPGIFALNADLSVGVAIEELVLVALASQAGDWEGQVRFLPL